MQRSPVCWPGVPVDGILNRPNHPNRPNRPGRIGNAAVAKVIHPRNVRVVHLDHTTNVEFDVEETVRSLMFTIRTGHSRRPGQNISFIKSRRLFPPTELKWGRSCGGWLGWLRRSEASAINVACSPLQICCR